MSAASEFKYAVQQKLFYADSKYPYQLFDVVVLETKGTSELREYFIKHKLWPQPKHDKWVHENTLMPITPETVEQQKCLKFLQSAAGRRKLDEEKHRLQEAESHDLAQVESPRAKRPKRVTDAEECEDSHQFSTPPKKATKSVSEGNGGLVKRKLSDEMQAVADRFKCSWRIAMPLSVLLYLMNDAELVKFNAHLVVLPKAKNATVEHYLLEWHANVKKSWEQPENRCQRPLPDSTVSGYLELFDRMLPLSLLYRNERVQCVDLQAGFPELRFSQMYGMEHFLRFLTTLPTNFEQVMDFNDVMFMMSSLLQFCCDKLLIEKKSAYAAATKTYLARFDTAAKYCGLFYPEQSQ